MPILTERKTWRRERPANETRGGSSGLTPTEQANVRAAIRFMRARLGSMAKLAAASGTKVDTLKGALKPRGSVSATIALRVARAAGVPIDNVLSGKWPLPGVCPHCGR